MENLKKKNLELWDQIDNSLNSKKDDLVVIFSFTPNAGTCSLTHTTEKKILTHKPRVEKYRNQVNISIPTELKTISSRGDDEQETNKKIIFC